jgi:ADP-ribose pyrophosphatase YjhB (NUDIX family)
MFRHDDPAAGIQAPGGTLDPGETAIEGAGREAFEVTGLTDFADASLIAMDTSRISGRRRYRFVVSLCLAHTGCSKDPSVAAHGISS